MIQIASSRGIRSVNIIREGPNMVETANRLRGMGASVVTTLDTLRQDCGE